MKTGDKHSKVCMDAYSKIINEAHSFGWKIDIPKDEQTPEAFQEWHDLIQTQKSYSVILRRFESDFSRAGIQFHSFIIDGFPIGLERYQELYESYLFTQNWSQTFAKKQKEMNWFQRRFIRLSLSHPLSPEQVQKDVTLFRRHQLVGRYVYLSGLFLSLAIGIYVLSIILL